MKSYLPILLISFFVAGCTSLPIETPALATSEQRNTPPNSTSIPAPIGAVVSPEATQPRPAIVLPDADASSQQLVLPVGFEIRIFQDGLTGRPRMMAFGNDGKLYVSLISAGQIVRLGDENQDGLADEVELVVGNLNQPHGLEWHDGWLYIAENDRVQRFLIASDGQVLQRELVTGNIPGGGGHFTRTLHFGPDGKLYVSTGSTCNVCEESDPRRAAILRFNPDGSIPEDNPFARDADERRQAVWAWGLRNSVDFLWSRDGLLLANNNGRDNLLDENGIPDHLPPEMILLSVERGGFYGWPYCYSPASDPDNTGKFQIADPQSGLQLPVWVDCGQIPAAVFTDLAHSAPLGMSAGSGSNFPVDYQDDYFVAYHGSWNVSNPDAYRDCKIARVIMENGQPVGSVDFVNGWRTDGRTCGDGSAYGRPADVVFGPDGSMFISDDAAGRVYRVVYTGSD